MHSREPAQTTATPDEGPASVVFLRPHIHAGVQYLPGDRCTIADPGDLEILRGFGVIEAAPPTDGD